jgi:hypothetical protein
MEYTPSQFSSLLNPCDYNHSDLPFVPTKNYSNKINLRRRKAIHHVREELEKGNIITTAIYNSGIKSKSTLYKWVKEIPRLKFFLQACEERGMQRRIAIVNDAFFKKLAEGKASGTEYEFFLCNREPSMWKKQTEFVGGSTGNAPVLPQRPLIQYIAVTVDNTGNGNGHRIENHV